MFHNPYLFEDFFDDNNLDLTDVDSEIIDDHNDDLPVEKIQESAEMVLYIDLYSNKSKYYPKLIKPFLNTLFSTFNGLFANYAFYEMNGINGIGSIRIKIFYSLKSNVNINLLFNFFKTLLKFFKRNQFNGCFYLKQNKQVNSKPIQSTSRYTDCIYSIYYDIIILFYVNNLLDAYFNRFGIRSMLNLLSQHYYFDGFLFDYTKKNKHIYAILPLFSISEVSNKEIKYILSFPNRFNIINDISAKRYENNSKYYILNNIDNSFCLNYDENDFKNALQSPSIKTIFDKDSDVTTNSRLMKKIGTKTLHAVWHSKIFMVDYYTIPYKIPAIAVEFIFPEKSSKKKQ